MAGEVLIEKAALGDGQAVQQAVESFFARLPAANRLTPQSHVLVKPNMLSQHPAEHAVTTHPALLRAVLQTLQKLGIRDITVADSPGGPYSPESVAKVYAASGITAVCEELGVHLYTGCESTEVDATALPHGLVRRFTLIQPALDCDFLISLPKMKTHVMTCMSGAVKNLFGLVPGLLKAEFHMRFPQKPYFGQMLVDLCETAKADMHIVDGLLAMQGDGPAGGEPYEAGLLLAGENPYHIDLALCGLMGLPVQDVPMLVAAQKNGLCPEALAPELFVGSEELKQPLPDFKPPRSYEGRLNFESHVPRILWPILRPLSIWAAPKPSIRKADCIGCGRCAEICPQKVISIQKGKAKIAYKECIHCFCCHEICPVKAIDVTRKKLLQG